MPSDDLPSLKAIRAFEATARLGSASAAAESLNITHGAISRQIRLLEEELGGALFIRQGRKLILNDAGRSFANACSRAFDQLKNARREFHQHHMETPVVLNCPGSLLARWLIPRLDRINKDLPDLHLRLVTGDQSGESPNDDTDARLSFTHQTAAPDDSVHPLIDEQIGPVIAPDTANRLGLMPDKPGNMLDQKLLSEYPLLSTTSRPQAWPEWFKSQGLRLESLKEGQDFEHLYYLLEAAEAGLGIAIAPRLLVEDAMARGRLIAPWGFITTRASLSLTYRKAADPLLQGRLTRLSDWLIRELRSSSQR